MLQRAGVCASYTARRHSLCWRLRIFHNLRPCSRVATFPTFQPEFLFCPLLSTHARTHAHACRTLVTMSKRCEQEVQTCVTGANPGIAQTTRWHIHGPLLTSFRHGYTKCCYISIVASFVVTATYVSHVRGPPSYLDSKHLMLW
jgi:hypothetical protein